MTIKDLYPDPEVQKAVRSIRRLLNKAEREDVANHGADAGWSGFTYTRDCVKWYNRHEEAIWELLHNTAEDMGENVPQLIAGFGRIDMADSPWGFKNLLAWFALEAICRIEVDAKEAQHASKKPGSI